MQVGQQLAGIGRPLCRVRVLVETLYGETRYYRVVAVSLCAYYAPLWSDDAPEEVMKEAGGRRGAYSGDKGVGKLLPARHREC
jgi:hypothetical protein